MWETGREKWTVRCTGGVGGRKDGYFNNGWYFRLRSLSGLFPLLTVLSGFHGNSLLLHQRQPSPPGLGAVTIQVMGWTLDAEATQQGRQCAQTKAKWRCRCPAIKLKAFRLCCCCLCLFLKRHKDTKEKRKQGKILFCELYEKRGLHRVPRLFLTSSQ